MGSRKNPGLAHVIIIRRIWKHCPCMLRRGAFQILFYGRGQQDGDKGQRKDADGVA